MMDAWADDRVALLRDMVAKGAETRDIAAALGITRSAVHGKLRRLAASGPKRADTAADRLRQGIAAGESIEAMAVAVGLPLVETRARLSTLASQERSAAEREADPAARRALNDRHRKIRELLGLGAAPGPQPKRLPPAAKRERAPARLMADPVRLRADTGIPLPGQPVLPLLALNEHTCHWPLGDPLEPGFGFCGIHTEDGRSYCSIHHRRAYTTPPPKPVSTYRDHSTRPRAETRMMRS